VVSDQQRPATEGVAYVLQGEWDLAGRRCAPAAVSAGAATPGELRPQPMGACCWRRLRSNNHEKRVYWSHRDRLLPRAARAG
jgi:hypothetical protein